MGDDDGSGAGAPLGGRFVPAADRGPTAAPVLGATTTPWVLDLIRRFGAAGPSAQVCVHLAEDPDEPATWSARVPDLRTCRRAACTGAAAAVLQERLGRPMREEPTRCTTCGRVGVPVRGVGVAVGATMLRGTVCDDCLAAKPVPTPASATAPVTADAVRPPELEAAEEPIAVEPEELEAPDGHVRVDASGRRALRRGWLMAEACCRTTAAGLDRDQAVVGGLMVRAAKLARGLAGGVSADGAFVDDLALRTLTETTTTLWWLLRTEPARAAVAAAAFRDAGPAPDDGGELRGRLWDLGREADLVALLGPRPDAHSGSWAELTDRHLSGGPDGFALALEDARAPADPLRTLIAGEHLALACAAYVARMPTDLDPDHLLRLATEVSELRATVEPALGDAAARQRPPA